MRRSGKLIGVTLLASSFEKMNDINSSLEHSAMNAALKEAELSAAVIVSRSGRKQLTPIDVFFQKFPDAANGCEPPPCIIMHLHRMCSTIRVLLPPPSFTYSICVHSNNSCVLRFLTRKLRLFARGTALSNQVSRRWLWPMQMLRSLGASIRFKYRQKTMKCGGIRARLYGPATQVSRNECAARLNAIDSTCSNENSTKCASKK